MRCPSVSSLVRSHRPSHDGPPSRGHHDEAGRELHHLTGRHRLGVRFHIGSHRTWLSLIYEAPAQQCSGAWSLRVGPGRRDFWEGLGARFEKPVTSATSASPVTRGRRDRPPREGGSGGPVHRPRPCAAEVDTSGQRLFDSLSLETPRLQLPALDRRHAATPARIYQDDEVARFIGRSTLTDESTRIQVDTFERIWREHEYGQSAMIERSTRQLTGRVGLHHWPVSSGRTRHVGHGIDPRSRPCARRGGTRPSGALIASTRTRAAASVGRSGLQSGVSLNPMILSTRWCRSHTAAGSSPSHSSIAPSRMAPR